MTSQTAICAAAIWALHAPPMLWAWMMSMRSCAISCSRVCAFFLSLNGLMVALTSGTHSPPNDLSSADQRSVIGGDQGAGAELQQRVGDVDGGAGDRVLAQRRHDLQYGRARQRARARLRLAVTVAH